MAGKMKVKAKVDGIPFVLDRSRLSDMDVLEILYDVQEAYSAYEEGEVSDGDLAMAVIPLARALFGRNQWDRIKDELRNHDSDIPHSARCIKFTFMAMDEASRKLKGELKN